MKGALAAILLWAAQAAPAGVDLNGITWHPVNPQESLTPADGSPAPLLPDARDTYRRNQASLKAGNDEFDLTRRCQPPGLPRLLSQPMPFEFLQRDEIILVVYQWNHLIRVVAMDVPQAEPIGPTFLGQSVGHWEADTLVIDTIAFNDTTLLDDLGMPHSESLHLTERYRLANDAQRLQLQLTIEDPQTFSKPWQAEFEFRGDAGGRLAEDVCVEREGVIFWNGDEQ